ncbi:MAG: fibronectin type III domain-containing protein [Okeania sp. SIO3B3]|nr:fibronectin type III domain-containing protein [Okeania sp. SIO3B3]
MKNITVILTILLLLLTVSCENGILGGGAPDDPTIEEAFGGMGSISVSWVDPYTYDIDQYTIYRSSSENGTFSPIGTVSWTADYYSDNDVLPGREYFYYVTASAGQAESGPSRVISGAAKIPKVDNFGVSIKNGGMDILLSWEAIDGISEYDVYEADNSYESEDEYVYVTTVTESQYLIKDAPRVRPITQSGECTVI